MQISQTKEQIDALAGLQAHCDLRSILLQSSSTTRAKAGTVFAEPFSVKPNLSNVSSSVTSGAIVVEAGFEYAAWDSSDPPVRLFLITCTFEISYSLRDDYAPSQDELASFGKGAAVFHCWPYVREFFSDVTARMGHAAPPLPLLRIVPKRDQATSNLALE